MPDIDPRWEDDPNFVSNRLEIEDDSDILRNQIENLLSIGPTDIIGHPELTVDLEKFVFSSTISENEMQNIIVDQINRFCPAAKAHDIRVEVTFYKGVSRDRGLIDILIDKKNNFRLAIA